MSQILRLRYLAVLFVCGLSITTGCDDVPPTESAGSSRSAKSYDVPQGPQVDSPEQLIGQRPPKIQVAKWLKGEPLTEFEPGKIYVIDFWATWCGPCIAAIPHLTKLAQESKGKVEVVGISIAERQKSSADTAYIDMVAGFVDKQGDRMDYRVAVDTPDKSMYETWFKPTGTGGIPTAYIIDQNGLVAWTGIGNPAEIDRIVHELLEGKFESNREVFETPKKSL